MQFLLLDLIFMVCFARRGDEMVRHIYDIGRGRYKFDKSTLSSFREEARNRPPVADTAEVPGALLRDIDLDDREMLGIFDEVMSLYHDYMRCQSFDLLLKLKCRLEQVSIRYQSHVLAAEVLNINSCLPYEHRINAQATLPMATMRGDDLPGEQLE
jgi:hypothetical protein